MQRIRRSLGKEGVDSSFLGPQVGHRAHDTDAMDGGSCMESGRRMEASHRLRYCGI